MKRIEIAAEQFEKYNKVLRCPLCSENMNVTSANSLICSNGHCFDLSKHGYVNLIPNLSKIDYNKDMLESRCIICKSGFFDKMLDGVKSVISELINRDNNCKLILDAGCGEGSHLSYIVDKLNEEEINNIQGFGIDISKDGIQIASREHSNIIWSVNDLANIAFTDKAFDIILNIFSPSNYSEFTRVLKKEGFLIKVVPAEKYLTELRSVFYTDTDKETYSNQRVIDHFCNNFQIIDKKEITYNVHLDEENLIHLIKMTPLSWNTDETKINEFLKSGIKEITVNTVILIGKTI